MTKGASSKWTDRSHSRSGSRKCRRVSQHVVSGHVVGRADGSEPGKREGRGAKKHRGGNFANVGLMGPCAC
jgi:hypothetical protein